MFGSFEVGAADPAEVALSPLGGFLACLLTGTHFSVSSGLGFLALFGVSVETGVIMVEYINQLRTRGMPSRGRHRRRGAAPASHHDDHAGRDAGPAARRAVARHRLRLAASLRHRDRRRLDGGSDHQRFLLPNLYVVLARDDANTPSAINARDAVSI